MAKHPRIPLKAFKSLFVEMIWLEFIGITTHIPIESGQLLANEANLLVDGL
jgi:hypothetical protein